MPGTGLRLSLHTHTVPLSVSHPCCPPYTTPLCSVVSPNPIPTTKNPRIMRDSAFSGEKMPAPWLRRKQGDPGKDACENWYPGPAHTLASGLHPHPPILSCLLCATETGTRQAVRVPLHWDTLSSSTPLRAGIPRHPSFYPEESQGLER